jgi:putative ABC transport system permease protein
MFKNYFKTGYRSLLKNRFHTSLNLLGLAMGFSACMLIAGYIRYEFSYEAHIEDVENVYRITYSSFENDQLIRESAKSPSRLGQVMTQEVPGVEASIRAYPEQCLIRLNDTKFIDQKVWWVDKEFFDVFQGLLIKGNPKTVLDAPMKIVITETKAQALFGYENPIGKEIKINEGIPMLVTGVVKNAPENSHLPFDYIASLSTFVHYNWIKSEGDWREPWLYSYAKLDEQAKMSTIQSGLDELVYANTQDVRDKGREVRLDLQPIQTIHLESHLPDEAGANGDIKYIYIVGGIGVAIFFIVLINFINLSTALSLKKTKDTGVRKTFGATRVQLIMQHLVEAFLLTLIAFLVSVVVVLVSGNLLEQFLDVKFNLTILELPQFWFGLLLLVLFLVAIASFYPAMIIANYSPINALKGKLVKGKKSGEFVQQSLLVAQFVAAIFLTTGATIVFKQVQYMRSSDLGIELDHTLIMQGPNTYNSAWNDFESLKVKRKQFETFSQELSGLSGVRAVGSSWHIPGEEARYPADNVKRVDTGEAIAATFAVSRIDHGFFPVFQPKFLAGENFRKEEELITDLLIINDTARKTLGFKSPHEAVGNSLKINNRVLRIQAVIADFHMKGLSSPIEPMLFENRHPHEFGYYLVKLGGQSISNTLAEIESIWNGLYPNDPFYSFFSDAKFNDQYLNDERFGRIFGFFTFISIFIAILGLVALISLTVAERMKEIGVRRVLGASMLAITTLLSTRLVRIVLLALFISLPLSWLVLSNWLNGFAYRIDMPVFVMAACGLVVFAVALLSVGFYIMKAGSVNPVTILRDE